MNTGTEKAKKRTSKKATPVKQEEKAITKTPKKPDTPKEWLEKYISQGEQTTSGAKLCTYLLTNKEGANIQYLIQRCSEIASMKQSNWGKTSSSIKSHLRFLKQKGCKIEELEKDVFRVSA